MSQSIVFCGSPDFACPTLEALFHADHLTILAVISQPDKVRHRGRQVSSTPVKALALQLGIPTYTPESKSELSDLMYSLNPDWMVVVAYGMIFPSRLVSDFYAINAHASLLPAYRGASPIQSSLLHNDTKTGVTLIRINEKMDSGNMLDVQEIPIRSDDNFQTLHDRLSLCSAELLLRWFNNLSPDHIQETQQDHTQATYCRKIKKEDLFLNSDDSPELNYAKIRAFSPSPCAYTLVQNKRVKIVSAQFKEGLLVPDMVKPEGKQMMSYYDFMQGYQQEIKLC